MPYHAAQFCRVHSDSSYVYKDQKDRGKDATAYQEGGA